MTNKHSLELFVYDIKLYLYYTNKSLKQSGLIKENRYVSVYLSISGLDGLDEDGFLGVYLRGALLVFRARL